MESVPLSKEELREKLKLELPVEAEALAAAEALVEEGRLPGEYLEHYAQLMQLL